MLGAMLSALALGLTGVLCIVGVLHERYRDTLLERIGMAVVGLWALARMSTCLSADACVTPAELMLHFGLASFSGGMAVAKWRSRHCDCHPGQASDGQAAPNH
jgi:hypothetical protein